MAMTKYQVKNKKSFGLFAVVVIAGMFLIRWILLETGTIDEMYTLDEEELAGALDAYEVTLVCTMADGSVSGAGGTILDGRKNSTSDEEYTLTIVTAYSSVGAGTQESRITVLLPDGTEEEGSIVAWNEDGGYTMVQCSYPEELEVYYSRDILYRLSEEEPAYLLSGDEVLSAGTPQTDVDADGIGMDLISVVLSGGMTGSEVLKGCGLYGKSGNYLGMVLECLDDGTVYAVPGDVIMAALDAVL